MEVEDVIDIEDIFLQNTRWDSNENSNNTTTINNNNNNNNNNNININNNHENHEEDKHGIDQSNSVVLLDSSNRKKEVVGYDIPGTQTVYMKTFGCSHNTSDSEYMAGQLTAYGYTVTDQFSKADIFIINSCTVKNPSQDSFFSLVNRAKASQKPVIVAGCIPQGQPKHQQLEGLSVIGVQQINRVVEVVEETLRGNTVRFLNRTKKSLPSLDLPKVRKNNFIEIIPINVGCLNKCTYCKTKHARGNLVSYSVDQIVNRVTSVLEEGVKEIRLTSEDTGAYGRDIGSDLPILCRAILPLLPDGVMLRIGMTNPPYILAHLDAIAQVLNHPNVYSFLHIPVQSGSNKVLRDMAREYTVEDFKLVADTLIKISLLEKSQESL